ncbi:MAG TPA: hypothetical protein VNX15_06845 [Gemmatimonadales bacterium]|jgi:uncharacterized membrane protein YheB (UPF0754 family)|nr:hypothetical protein [Gemmatimonadales bacterium]
MSEPLWLQGLVLVGVGALAGGITTSLGVWLLFHPHEPLRLGPFTLQGVIPKNQARLAQVGSRAVALELAEHLGQVLGSPELAAAVRRFIAGQRAELLHDERPLLDRLPAGLRAALEQGITDYLPVAVEHFGAALADPAARPRIRDALKTVLSESPKLKARLSLSVNEAVVEFLRTPIAERLWALGPDRLDGLEQTAGDYITAALHAPETRVWAVERLADVVAEQVERKLLGQSLTQLEELTRKGSEQELRVIVRLGCGLGALVGAAAWGLSRLFG